MMHESNYGLGDLNDLEALQDEDLTAYGPDTLVRHASRRHEHDEQCADPAYALGYLSAGVRLFLEGHQGHDSLRADLARVDGCRRAAGLGSTDV